nr:flagellar transcriptional regulator FlhD [Burkholderia ubonensis]
MLAQRLLHDDRKAGMFRLGLSAPLADLLSTPLRARMPSPLDDANSRSIRRSMCSDTRAYPVSDRARIAGELTRRHCDESGVLS